MHKIHLSMPAYICLIFRYCSFVYAGIYYSHQERKPLKQSTERRKEGGEDMKTPSTSELLVEEERTAERLRLLILASECETLEEFRKRLQELINRQ